MRGSRRAGAPVRATACLEHRFDLVEHPTDKVGPISAPDVKAVVGPEERALVTDLDGASEVLRIDHEHTGWADGDVVDIRLLGPRLESIVEHFDANGPLKPLADSLLARGASVPRLRDCGSGPIVTAGVTTLPIFPRSPFWDR